MKEELKAGGVLVGTLLAGIIVGFIASHKNWEHEMRRFEPSRMEGAFPEIMLQRIAADSTQRETIRPILEKYGKQFAMLQKQHFIQLDSVRSAFESELLPLLNEKQKVIIEQEKKNHREHPRMGPPPLNDRPEFPPMGEPQPK